MGKLSGFYLFFFPVQNVSFIQLNLTPGREGVLRISSDRDDRRMFWGLNFRFLDFFGLENFGKYK